MIKHTIKQCISLYDFAQKFINLNDMQTESITDISDLNIRIKTLDKNGNNIYVPIKSFVVKSKVQSYYTDGILKCSSNHIIVEDNNEIKAKNHPDFKLVNDSLYIVDIEVDSEEHTYLANGRLNHNTTSGGKAIGFHSSVRLRLQQLGQLKTPDKDVVGIETKATVVKNRIGPPLRSCTFNIIFSKGIDKYSGWYDVLKNNDIITVAGAWSKLEIVDKETGEIKEYKFYQKDFIDLILNKEPQLKDICYSLIADKLILKYDRELNQLDETSLIKEETVYNE